MGCHFRFMGQFEDEESGLYYNRHRYYSPEIAQYISADPIGLLGGFNPYGYVHNPLKLVDPYGLSGTPVIAGAKPFSSKSYTEVEKDSLPDWMVKSFKNDEYKTVVTTEDTVLYRTFGGNARIDGGFVTTSPSSNKIQAKIDSALLPEWKNTRQYESTIVVPKGTRLQVGKVKEQFTKSGTRLDDGADQIVLPLGYPMSWVKDVRFLK
ncbi:RHS repeat-associated core domain-containing protein [Xenorhabdus bovienii]|uniref:RHS repeat-associated core domain-containing protein n=1 Tax=Xenorhabdus bovienii TaxID=40576 RepID=UPI003B97DD65